MWPSQVKMDLFGKKKKENLSPQAKLQQSLDMVDKRQQHFIMKARLEMINISNDVKNNEKKSKYKF